jgi:hypothetical protein
MGFLVFIALGVVEGLHVGLGIVVQAMHLRLVAFDGVLSVNEAGGEQQAEDTQQLFHDGLLCVTRMRID